MKRTLFIMILALLSSTLMAQERPRQAVFAEFLGASGIIGVSYDSRFKTSEHWGYRFGLSFNAGGESETFISSDKDYQGPSLLVEGNYLIGKGRHFLELGLGMMHGFFKPLFDKDEMFYDGNPWSSSSSWGTSEDWEYGYYCYVDVGYRFQPVKGVIARAGICPSFVFGDEYGLRRSFFYPYVSVGYAFYSGIIKQLDGLVLLALSSFPEFLALLELQAVTT